MFTFVMLKNSMKTIFIAQLIYIRKGKRKIQNRRESTIKFALHFDLTQVIDTQNEHEKVQVTKGTCS